MKENKTFLMITFLLILFFSLTGCSNNSNSNENIEYINKADADVLTYKFDTTNFDKQINDVTELDLTKSLTFIVFEVNTSLEDMDTILVGDLHEKLISDEKISIVFLGFNNYNFFRNTGLANETDYYPSNGYALSISNFNSESGLSYSHFTMATDENKILDSYITHIVSSQIKDYLGKQ